MLHLEFRTLLQAKRIFVVLGLSAALAGCAIDDFAKEETFVPYGGSKQHPIKVANGKASVERCDDWSENRADTLENDLAASHGCAVQSNIAAMAANPNDLVRARPMSRPPAFSRVKPIGGLGGSAGGTSADATVAAKP